ncbi:hypothetical protein ACFWN5_06960 [Streptomyces sp. NPDC058430]
MKHSDPAVLEALDLAWDAEDGVLGKLRDGPARRHRSTSSSQS